MCGHQLQARLKAKAEAQLLSAVTSVPKFCPFFKPLKIMGMHFNELYPVRSTMARMGG
jgi:hypothetical protein